MTTHKSHYERKKELIREFALSIKKCGYRAFIAELGTYGFFTDEEGTRVVSFHEDYGDIHLSGNYITDNPRSSGTGWGMGTYPCLSVPKQRADEWFNAVPFREAISSCRTWRYTTLEEHLKTYQQSSKYEEI